MDIKLTESRVISQKYEKHYKILINGKEVYVSKWFNDNEFGFEGDTEIFKGQELLTEEEQEAILNFVNETLADKGE